MISNQLAKQIIVSAVRYPNGRVGSLDDNIQNPEEEKGKVGDGWMEYDATRPLEGNCDIKLLKFEDDKGRECFWHSSAHVLGETLELEFGVHLTHGPPTQDGFFYDSYTGSDVSKSFFLIHCAFVLIYYLNCRNSQIKTTRRSISAPRKLQAKSNRLNALS